MGLEMLDVVELEVAADRAEERYRLSGDYRDWVLAALAWFRYDRAWARYDYERRHGGPVYN